MNKCKKCGGAFILTEQDYILETRHPQHPRLKFEDTKMFQCKICGSVELTSESTRIIQLVKNKLKDEMRDQTTEQKDQDNSFSTLKRALQRFIP